MEGLAGTEVAFKGGVYPRDGEVAMRHDVRKRRDTPEGPVQWTITYQQKAGNVLVFGLMTSTLSLVVGAPVALALTALYWAAGLGGLENLPVIMPTALGVSLPFSAWICRSRLWWTVRFEDYTLRLGNSFSGKVFPCERIILVRAGSNTGLAVAPGGINMEGMVPVEVVSERHGRCTVHMTLYQATDLLHFLDRKSVV